MKKLLFSIVFFMFLGLIKAQEKRHNNYFLLDIAGGTSSLTGWSTQASFFFERRHNIVGLRINYNNQTGNRKEDPNDPGFFAWKNALRYNDRFGDLALLYGGTLRNNYCFVSLTAGPAYFRFTDKFLEGEYNWGKPAVDFNVGKKRVEGWGFALESKVLFIPDDNLAIGLVGFADLNYTKNIAGIAFVLTCGIVRR
jgi:hypothetical protein